MAVPPVFLVVSNSRSPGKRSSQRRTVPSRTSSSANDTRNSCFKRVPHDRETPTNGRAVFAGWHGNGGFIPDWPSSQGRRRVWRSGCHDDREMLACDWPADSQAKASRDTVLLSPVLLLLSWREGLVLPSRFRRKRKRYLRGQVISVIIYFISTV